MTIIQLLRSLAFNILFFFTTALFSIGLLPLLPTSRPTLFKGVRLWARTTLWLLKVVVGLGVEFRGLERLPKGALVVAAKHQSALETLALVLVLPDFTYVLKRELVWIPLFGWYLQRTGMIPVRRGARSAALRSIVVSGRKAVAEGRQIIVFPEGTRREPGAPPAYKFGVAHLYAELGVPLQPVALDTGLFWRRRSFVKRPGRAVIEFLEPIAPGLTAHQVLPLLQERIEAASAALAGEASRRGGLAPLANAGAAAGSTTGPTTGSVAR